MQLTCRRCTAAYSADAGYPSPCPVCGSIEPAPPLPMTIERASFSAPLSQPGGSEGAPSAASAPIVPHPGHVPDYAYLAAPYPAAQVAQAAPAVAPYPYFAQQAQTQAQAPQGAPPYPPAVNVVIHNHIVPGYAMNPMTYPQPGYAQPAYAPATYAASAPSALAPYVRRKDPGVAALLSCLLPGVGQLYNGQVAKGLMFVMVSLFVNFPLMFVGVGFVTSMVTWIWAMVDAHASAERINRGGLVA